MRISGKARLAGIMGWPVAHSRSPALHGFWLAENGIDGAYVPLPVRPHPENVRYLRTKRDRMGHLLDGLDQEGTA